MTLNEYQETSSRTANNHEYALANFGLGIAGEAGEVVDLIKKAVFHNHEIDKEVICKELGDVLWYLSQIASLAGIELDNVAIKNIEKLKKRYPDGFSTERSVNREEYQTYKLLEPFGFDDCIGDIMTLDEFMNYHVSGGIIPYDGCIGDVIVDGKVTNIRVVGWNMWMSQDYVEMNLDDLKDINGKVEIHWCNK